MSDMEAPGSVARPVGKVRSPVLVIVFAIITLGIYWLYWMYQVGRELQEYAGQGLGPVVDVVLAFFLGFVLWFTVPNDIKATYEAVGDRPDVSAMTGFWNLIPFVGGIIWIVKVQNRLNRLWEQG